jgi:hypothetical protein
MNIQPSLKGDLIAIRPLKAEDYDHLLQAASNPLIWEQHPQSDRYKPEVFLKFFTEAINSKGALVVIDLKTSEIIGTTRFYDYSAENSSLTIGYTFIMRKYWGGLYNRDLKKLVVNYALQFVNKTLFQVGLNNKRSQQAMEKLGAINTGIEEVVISYGPPKKSYIYVIDKPLTGKAT